MWSLTFFVTLFRYMSPEMALKSYDLEVGQAPQWMNATQQKAAVVDRWYVDKATATCKPFKYLGSLGNFNNFVSKEICQYHLKFTPEEQTKACTQPKSEGICELPNGKRPIRWYYSKNAPAGSTEKHTCHDFKYSGCGGNANNFESKRDCLNACQNSKNGDVTERTDESGFAKVPNAFDCLFTAEVDSHDPIMGVVLHKNKKKCVYAAVGKTSERGYFNDLPKCVETCITEKVAACSAAGPHQVASENIITLESDVKDYFYYNQGRKACLPFFSKAPNQKFIIDDGAHNIFSSAELCASFCPAIGHLGDVVAVNACTQPMIGEASQGEKYQLDRYYYKTSGNNANTCQKFKFNGKETNMNNFKSIEACRAICKTPMATNIPAGGVGGGASVPPAGTGQARRASQIGGHNNPA